MTELKDYSGEFKRDLKWEDFSKEALVQALKATSRCVTGLDGFWYSLVKERFGEKVAGELDAELWKKMTWFELTQIQKALNIHGDDIATMCKFLQNSPDSIGVLHWDCDIKNRNLAIGTVTHCRALEYMERHGDYALMKTACEAVDAALIPQVGRWINPKIKVTCLKLPPRKSKDEACCQWEIKLQED